MKAHPNETRLPLILAASLSLLTHACTSMQSANNPREVDVAIAEMSDPARAALQNEIGAGHIEKITQEFERGKTVYDVEATIAGKHMEYLIDAADGKILGTEVPIAVDELPGPVHAAAEKYFGTTQGLTVMKGVEYGETHYEIEGPKKGKKVEVTYDPQGKRTE